MTVLAIALAVVVGLTLGMLGGGGSILTVPLLVYVAGLDTKEAIATSLLVVGVTSAVGAVRVFRQTDTEVAAAKGAQGGHKLLAVEEFTRVLDVHSTLRGRSPPPRGRSPPAAQAPFISDDVIYA